MKSFKFLPLFLCFCLFASLLSIPCAALSPAPTLNASSAIVVDRRSGSVIYSKDADRKVYPASTTKVLTVLLAVEAIERGETSESTPVTASATAMQGLSELGSTAGIVAGETMTLRNLMDCAMISSANEACNVIAEHLAGTVTDFAALMNRRAAELGCTGSHFANAHGLPNTEHYTTASDFALITLEATRHPLFMEICGTAEITIPATNKSPARNLHNSNALICKNSMYGSGYLYDGAAGIKTGHTTAAGYCLASAASRGGVDLIALVFGASSSDGCFKDTIHLYDWTFGNYSYRQILTAADCVSTVPVLSDGELDYVELHPAQDFFLLLPNDCDLSEFSREVTVYGSVNGSALTGPLTSGAALGKVQLLKNGEEYGSIDLVPVSSSALILDCKTGEVLFSKGRDNRVYPADTTKIMTALLAVEAVEKGLVSMNDLVTVTEAMNIDLSAESSRCGIQPGEIMTLQALLDCAMLSSADDACNMIAEYVAGSVPAFVIQMNQRAAALGCTATSFVNTHGSFSPEHYTTARDFSLIALEASRHDLFMRICGSSSAELDETNLSPARTLKNTNALLTDDSVYGRGYVYEGATGMKTGYNSDAGYALAATASRNGISLLSVVFGGVLENGDFSCFSDTVTMFDEVFNNYSYQEVLKSTENIASVDIALGSDTNYVNLRPNTSISVLLPNDCDLSEFEKDIRVYALENGETVTAPVTAGQVLGEVTVTRGGRSYGTVKLVASSTVELSRAQYIKSQLQETLHQPKVRITALVLIVLFAAYLIWVIIYRVRHLRHVMGVRAAEKARSKPELPPTPENPDIEFIRGDAPPRQADTPPAPVPAAPAPAPAPVVPISRARSAAPDRDDLLRDALLLAQLPPEPDPEPETSEQKAERDYFEEFFRQK